jgi:hypothetical protein
VRASGRSQALVDLALSDVRAIEADDLMTVRRN